MAEFVQCPQCGLKHTRREDGLCPRCKNASASAPAPAAAPIVEPLKAGEPEKPGVATAGSRAAGILLLANAALLLASFVIAPGQGGFAAGPHGVILDSVVGVGLLSGRVRWHKWAYVRAVLGGVVFGGVFAAQGDWASLLFQLMLSGSLVMLLFGDPGRLRMGGAFALCAPYLAAATLGLASLKTGGGNPLATSILSAKGEITAASGMVQGQGSDYCVEVPAQSWFLRTDAAARKDNPLADRWLIRPDVEAHVMTIVEDLPEGMTVEQERYEEALLTEARKNLSGFQLVEREPLSGGAALHYTGHLKNLDLEYYRGAFAEGSHAYQVIAFSTPKHFARLHDELTAIVRSFRSHCASPASAAR